MHFNPKKVYPLTLFAIAFSIFFSCSKDSDLLLDSLLIDPEMLIEVNEASKPELEEGFETRTFEFSPINDAYIQEEKGYDHVIIRLQENYRKSYLMFDLTKVNGSIKEAVLQFSIDSDEGDGNITIHTGTETDWTEENLKLTNAPKLDTEIGSLAKSYKIGARENVALSPGELNSEQVTIIMTHNGGNDLAFASKENMSKKGPKLIITYIAPESSPVIEQQIEEPMEEDTPEEETPQIERQPKTDTTSNEGGFFVTTNGNSSNDGLSEANAWSIEHAFSNAVAGDVVHVKAGNYGNKQLIADNTGTPGNLIKFIGYTNNPGDLVSIENSTFAYGDTIDSNKMPLLVGSAPNNEGQGTAIRVIEPYILIENFQITRYENGLYAQSDHSIYKNIIVSLIGDYNPSHTYPGATSNHSLNYKGNGIIIEGNGSELLNSFAINCGAQAITFQKANNIKASNNNVYADNTVNPTDYYFLIGTDTKNSIFTNTYIYRSGSLLHLGHGIVAKGQDAITGNVVDGFHIVNTFLEVQFPNTTNNSFKNGTVVKEPNINTNTKDAGGLRLANGSKNNHYENIVLANCSIKFSDWNDGLKGDVNDASDNNTFLRIQVKDSYSAIAFSHFLQDNHSSSADNNTFTDCTFSNVEYLFEVDRANSDTKLINCSINNVSSFSVERISGGASYTVQSTYQNCSWNNNGFNAPE